MENLLEMFLEICNTSVSFVATVQCLGTKRGTLRVYHLSRSVFQGMTCLRTICSEESLTDPGTVTIVPSYLISRVTGSCEAVLDGY